MGYDIAAYIWPSYTGDEPRTRIFWPEGMGEWQSVRSADAKFPDHNWPRHPRWGYQNEADPAVMEMQIEQATRHGVNVFIYDWYWYDRRPFLEQCLDNGFLQAENREKMRFYLMWANHDALSLWDKRTSDDPALIWSGQVDRPEFERIALRILERYFTQPNYYTIDGKPVFMIYDTYNLIQGLGGVDKTREALDWWRGQCMKAGLPGLHLQMTVWREHQANLSGVDGIRDGSAPDAARLLGYDSLTHYQFVHFTDIDRTYAEVLPDVQAEWQRLSSHTELPYFPHVSIGWDNNPRYRQMRPGILRDNTPEMVEKALRMAKAYADGHPNQPPLITVNSWNEWTESSYLEPDDLYGYGYLEAVQRVFGGAK